MELSDVLSDKAKTEPTPKPEPKAEAAPPPEAPVEKVEPEVTPDPPKEEKPRAPDGKFAKKEEREEMTPKEKALLSAAADERRKRQDLEKRLAEYEAKPKEPEKTFWEDPEAALARQEEKVTRAITSTRLATAEAIARQKYPDFEENAKIFGELVSTTPGLAHQMMSAADPAEFAYRYGKNHKALSEVGNLDAYREKIEKELRVKLEAEYKAKEEARKKEIAALPGSLSDTPGTGAAKATWGGPTSLDSIVAR